MSFSNRTILTATLTSVLTGTLVVEIIANDGISVNDLVYNNLDYVRIIKPTPGIPTLLTFITAPVITYDASLSSSDIPSPPPLPYTSPSGEYFEVDTVESPNDIDRIYYDASGSTETGWTDITIRDYVDNTSNVHIVFALPAPAPAGATVDMTVDSIVLTNQYRKFTLANSFGLIKNYTRGYRAMTSQKTFSTYAFVNRKNQLVKGLQNSRIL